MKDNQLKEKASYFSEKYKYKNHIKAVILAFGLVVFLGTAYGLSGQGHAKTHTVKELNCSCQVHQHSDDCYDADGNLVCGQADYVVHEHNDDCYDTAGNLVCTLSEIKAHVHTDDCYEEESVLVCGQEESEGHVHTDACYEMTGGELICGLDEHIHSDDCYDEEGNLICILEEHIHTDDCYAPMEETLVCGMEEGEGAHAHTDACYETQEVPVCGENELHTHTEDCYDEDGNLICGLLELKEHVHGEDCFTEREMTADEIRQMEDALEEEEAKSETKEDKALTQTAETENYIITATYTEAAEIPEDAVFQAKEITEESDPEGYESYLNQLRETYGEGYEVTFMIDSGFYVDGKEYEPKVSVDIEIEPKNGANLQNNTVNHFKENGSETKMEELAPSVNDDGKMSYSQDSFSVTTAGTTNSTSSNNPTQITMEVGDTYTITVPYACTWKKYASSNFSGSSTDTSVISITNDSSGSSSGTSANTTTITANGTGTFYVMGRVSSSTKYYYRITVTEKADSNNSSTDSSTIAAAKITGTTVIGSSVTLRAGSVTGMELSDFSGYSWSVKSGSSYGSLSTTAANEPVVTGSTAGTVTVTGTKTSTDGSTQTITWTVTVQSTETGTIQLVRTNASDIYGAPNIFSVTGYGKNSVRYTVMLVDDSSGSNKYYYVDFLNDGTVKAYLTTLSTNNSYEPVYTYDAAMTAKIQGAVAPVDFTFNTTKLELSPTVLSKMGISIPGYTFENGYCFFFYYNFFGSTELNNPSGTKTTYLRNFGQVSNARNTGTFANYIGYTRLDQHYTDYSTSQIGSDTGDWLAYQANGTLRFVFKIVSATNPYHVNYVDFFDQTSGTTFKQDKMKAVWNSGTSSYDYKIDQSLYTFGDQMPLYTPTDTQLAAHTGYTFKGWYKSVDADGNGTGELASTDLDATFNSDVTYYARWEAPTAAEDTPYINVTKTFSGLTEAQIENLKSSFEITVTGSDDSARILKLTDEDVTVSSDKLTYSWKLEGESGTTYTVKETGTSLTGYNLTSGKAGDTDVTGTSGASVTIEDASVTVTPSTENNLLQTSCAGGSYEISEDKFNFIVASLTGDLPDDYIVWTKNRLSENEKRAFIKAFAESSDNGTLKKIGETDISKIVFQSGDKLKNAIIYNNARVQYSSGKLTFSNSSWNMFQGGTYSINSGSSAEIAVVNTYTRITADITFRKEESGSVGEAGYLSGAVFELYKGSYEDKTGKDTTKSFTSSDEADHKGEFKISNLTSGDYYLIETTAPDGYDMLTEPVVIKVNADGDVTVTYKNAPIYDENSGFYIIYNTKGNKLPATGGSGTAIFTLTGLMLLAAATFLAAFRLRAIYQK